MANKLARRFGRKTVAKQLAKKMAQNIGQKDMAKYIGQHIWHKKMANENWPTKIGQTVEPNTLAKKNAKQMAKHLANKFGQTNWPNK